MAAPLNSHLPSAVRDADALTGRIAEHIGEDPDVAALLGASPVPVDAGPGGFDNPTTLERARMFAREGARSPRQETGPVYSTPTAVAEPAMSEKKRPFADYSPEQLKALRDAVIAEEIERDPHDFSHLDEDEWNPGEWDGEE